MLQKVKSASVFQDKGSLWEKFLLNGSLYFALFVIIIVFGFLNSSYLTLNNIINVFEQSAYLLVCSIGMTFTLLIGAFDLSIGGNLAFLSVVGGALMVKTGNVPLSIAVMFACALVVGLLNGIGVVKIGLPPFIMTISMGYIVRDIVDYYTESKTISGLPSQLMKMVWYKILGVPVLIWFGLLILALGIYLLNFTGYGRTVYACGGNTDASKVMGVSTDKVRISVFVISSLCTCIAPLW